MQSISTDMIYIRYADTDEPLVVLKAVIQRYGSKAAFMMVPDSLWSRLGKGTPYRQSARNGTKKNSQRGLVHM